MSDDVDPWGRGGRTHPVQKLLPPGNLWLVPVSEFAVVITRAENGYILQRIEEGRLTEQVFEEPQVAHEFGEQEALASCLYAAFEGHFQSKWRGGLKLSVKSIGREAENEETGEG